MKTGKLVLYAIAGLVALVAVAFVVQTVLAVLSLVATIIRLAALLAVLGGLGYVGYKLYSLLSGTFGSSSNSTEPSTTSPDFSVSDASSTGTESSQDSLQEQYVKGEISEAEFERRLERDLDNNEFDSIDRELQRERS